MNRSDADSCAELCSLAGLLADEHPEPQDFLLQLGKRAGGIQTGALWFFDAAVGGRNVFAGRGFKSDLDDGTHGQARHFAGIIASTVHLGGPLTRWVSVHLRRDAPDTADGRLTEEAIAFVGLIRSGELPVQDASGWLRAHLCG